MRFEWFPNLLGKTNLRNSPPNDLDFMNQNEPLQSLHVSNLLMMRMKLLHIRHGVRRTMERPFGKKRNIPIWFIFLFCGRDRQIQPTIYNMYEYDSCKYDSGRIAKIQRKSY